MPGAEQLTASAESGVAISGFDWKLGFLLSWSLQIPDLFNQIGLLIVKLFVLGPVILKLAEELYEFGLVLEEDVEDGLRLVGIGYKHLRGEKAASVAGRNDRHPDVRPQPAAHAQHTPDPSPGARGHGRAQRVLVWKTSVYSGGRGWRISCFSTRRTDLFIRALKCSSLVLKYRLILE